ncbi:MAG: transposase [Candidatus Kapabacteria bacterium]|nr:transposase [Candidatus Kapabacteria bacterium]
MTKAAPKEQRSIPILHTGYKRIKKNGYHHSTVNHSIKEYARDDDGDGFCEVHCNTLEGLWAALRIFL